MGSILQGEPNLNPTFIGLTARGTEIAPAPNLNRTLLFSFHYHFISFHFTDAMRNIFSSYSFHHSLLILFSLWRHATAVPLG